MKRLFTLLFFWTVLIAGATAQVYSTATGQDYLKADEIISKASSGELLVALQLHTTSSNKYLNSSAKMNDNFASDGATTWRVVPYGDDGYFALQNVKTGKYIGNSARPTTFTDDVASATLFLPVAVDNNVGDIASGYTAKDNAVRWKVAPAKSIWINANGASSSTTVQFNGGTGNWTCWFTYEVTVKYTITFNCYDEGDKLLESIVSEETYPDGETVDVSGFTHDILGYTLKSITPTSVTINGANAEVKVVYAASSVLEYTLDLTGDMPEGTTVTIKGEPVAGGGSVSSEGAVFEGDVVVTIPDEYSYMSYTVTISGATITVNFYDTRWPINFPKDQTFTRNDRHINSVTFEYEGGSQTIDGLYENTSTLCYQDLTATKTVTLGTGMSVHPSFNMAGIWQHGFVYIDLNNDGDFTDEGELVSKINEGNPNLATALPNFTVPAVGTYRMRIKSDWNSEDPGGNPGTPNNYIIDNGGMIVDVTLVVENMELCDLTYRVVDENEGELAAQTVQVPSGTVITEMPSSMLYTEFYDYTAVPETVVDKDTTIQVTATQKAEPLVFFTADTSKPTWLLLTMRPDNTAQTGYPTYVADGTPNVTLPNTSAMDETTMWAFIGTPYAGFRIINKAAGTDLVLGSESAAGDGDDGGKTYATLATSGTHTYEVWTIRSSSHATNGFYIYNAEEQYLNRRSSDNLAYWTGGHDIGSTFLAERVLDDAERYALLIAQLEGINWGTGLNEYGLTGDYADATSSIDNIISQLKAAGYTEENLATAQALLDNYALNMPKANTFLRIRLSALQVAGQPYLLGERRDVEGKGTRLSYGTEASDAASIWYFDGTNLFNYGKSGYPMVADDHNRADVAGEPGAEAVSVAFLASALESGAYNVQFNGNRYLFGWPEGYTDAGSSADSNGYNFNLEAVDALPVTVSSLGYATLYSPVALAVPAGITAYKAADSGDRLELTAVTSAEGEVIPALTGVILAGDEGTYTFAVTTTEETVTDNSLTGTLVPLTRPAYAYALDTYLEEETLTPSVCFSVDGDTTIPGFQAYLQAADDADPIKTFHIDMPDGIRSTDNGLWSSANQSGAVYDLSGRSVTPQTSNLKPQTLKKGLYIINGSKVVIK